MQNNDKPRGIYYTKKAIKTQFCKIVGGIVLKEFDIKLSNGLISEKDLELFTVKESSDTFYFLNIFLDNKNYLDHQKLKDFVYHNMSQFSFYKADVV